VHGGGRRVGGGRLKLQTDGARVVDVGGPVGVLEREDRQRLRQQRDAVRLDHVRRLQVLEVLVALAVLVQLVRRHGRQVARVPVRESRGRVRERHSGRDSGRDGEGTQ
jgi:hypothetical protein